MFMRYRIVAFRYLWSNRTLAGAKFQNDVSPTNIISVYVVGTLLVTICTILVIVALSFVVGGVAAAVIGPEQLQGIQQSLENPAGMLGQMGAIAVAGLAVLAYLVALAFAFAFGQIFVTRPILSRMAEAMTIHNAGALTTSRQRAHDRATEAGGFADALGVDVGAGF